MGCLAGFIAREFADADNASRAHEIGNDGAAILAIPAIRQPENSKNSENSRGSSLKTGQVCASCGSPACIAHGWFLRDTSRAKWFCSGCVPLGG